MGRVCQIMLSAFSENDAEIFALGSYDAYDLRQGLNWARSWLEAGIKIDPISGINYRHFISWAKHKRRLLIGHLQQDIRMAG